MTDENKTGPRLVAANDEREIRRHRAQEVVEEAFERLAANMLRVIRGAGQAHYLAQQCLGVVEACRAYHEAVGHWPPAHEIQAGLGIPRPAYHEDTIVRDNALHRIMSGSLQVIASKMLGQHLQEAAGDREIHDGMRQYEEWREERRRHYAAAAAAAARPAGSAKRKPYGSRRVAAKRKTKAAPKSST